MQILVHDVDPANLALLHAAVRHLGHEPAALDAAPDAMVFDPAQGPSLEAALAARARQPRLPIVCVSHRRPTRAVAELAPAAYVMKPFTIGELRRAIDHALATPRS